MVDSETIETKISDKEKKLQKVLMISKTNSKKLKKKEKLLQTMYLMTFTKALTKSKTA